MKCIIKTYSFYQRFTKEFQVFFLSHLKKGTGILPTLVIMTLALTVLVNPIAVLAASPAQPTGIAGFHRSGQTFLTWTEVASISDVAQTAKRAGADAVTISHRFQGMLVDVERRAFWSKTPYGYGGPWMLPIALAYVSKIVETCDVEICGSGGIFNWNHVLQYIFAGASVVQTATALYLLGVIGLVLLLTSIYLVMPIGGITPGHALLGGVVAAVLWEIARHILVWYFSTLSLVNLIYGTLASAIVALLFLEVAAMILLFGAQVIAEYERRDAGVDDKESFRT